MAKVVRCRDVGFDCDGVVRAETVEEVLKQVQLMRKPSTTLKQYQQK